MNPLKDESFEKYWDKNSEEYIDKREELLDKNVPTVNQVIDFIVDEDIEHNDITLVAGDAKNNTLLDKLYFIYKTLPVSNSIGWNKKPSKFGIGGELKLDFYKKLLKKLDDTQQRFMFPYVPGDIQTDEMLLDYLQNPPSMGTTSIGNYHGKKPKTSSLEWMIDNRIDTIKQWKPEWWTAKLKTRAINNEPFALAFIPDDLLTNAEIRKYLKDVPTEYSRHMDVFWKNLPNKFKNDPEIFARWLMVSGGLREKYRNIYAESYYTLESVKKYFELSEGPVFSHWKFVKTEWKDELIDYALPKVAGAIAIDEEVELTNSILEKTLENRMSDSTRAKIAIRLEKEGRLTKEIVEKLNLTFWGIEDLVDSDIKKITKNENVLDHLIKSKDNGFLSKKANWPKGVTVKKEHLIGIIEGLNFNYKKIKSRINRGLSDDDFAWVYFETNNMDRVPQMKIRNVLKSLSDDGIIKVSSETMDILEQSGPDSTFESYKNVSDIFLF